MIEAETWVEVTRKGRQTADTGSRREAPRTYTGEGNYYFSAESENIAVKRTRGMNLNIMEYTKNECFKLEVDESFIAWCAESVGWCMQQPEKEERRLRWERAINMIVHDLSNSREQALKIKKISVGGWQMVLIPEGREMKAWFRLKDALVVVGRARVNHAVIQTPLDQNQRRGNREAGVSRNLGAQIK
ncbi:hypothetical protein Scep_019012 [Stephania cephalantha]|uniref:Uncharacterized protein n=1 Tax=Stephania cephalantha TaxID=152367 RepID=A0AAP0IA40_9MAGN